MEWPDEVSGDSVTRACEAARLGVDTAIVLGSPKLRDAVQANLMEVASDAVFDPRFGVPTWVFKDGGELTLATNLNEAKQAHYDRLTRRPLGYTDLEVVYPKTGRL